MFYITPCRIEAFGTHIFLSQNTNRCISIEEESIPNRFRTESIIVLYVISNIVYLNCVYIVLIESCTFLYI